jgi:hypothetical protein
MSVAIDPQLADTATFIFEGTVLGIGPPSVPILEGRPNLAVARFERGFRVNPLLGDLNGRRITVGLKKGSEVREGERLIFFANSWVHGEEIAVLALAQVSADERTQNEVEAALKGLPELYLQRRVASAELIVQGQVEGVKPAELAQPVSEHMATWMLGEIAVSSVIKGKTEPKASVEVFFPRNTDFRWRECPKLKRGQRGVFLLHAATSGPLPRGALTLPDRYDVQPVGSARTIRELAGALPAEGGPQ